MIRRNYGYNRWSQLHTPSKGGIVAKLCKAHVSSFFVFLFYVQKSKMLLGLKDINKQNHGKITIKPLNPSLKNSNCKGNVVIQCSIKIENTKTPFCKRH